MKVAKAKKPVAGEYERAVETADLANSSIQIGPNTIETIVGPIHEWLPIPENLPNHPTLVSLFSC